MPFDKQLYHPEWRSIRDRIIQRAGNKCEVCGVENGAIGARNKNGEWMSELSIHQLNYDVGRELFNGEFGGIMSTAPPSKRYSAACKTRA